MRENSFQNAKNGFGFSKLIVSWLGSFLILMPLYLLLFA